ncbi:unnamed protein product [Ectocarpus sp. 12 AP-2014]
MAQYVHDRFSSFGIPSVEVQPVNALLSNPIQSSLELVDSNSGSVLFTASLSEDTLDLDTTSDTWLRNHTYNGYSPSGDVTAPLVYANYGRPEDFRELEGMGVSVDGAIVIVRYGHCFRGLKAMNAQERGAVGTIIYSDPQQDGFKRGPTYPDGGWRPSSSVQRGSCQFNSLCAGDPSRAANPRSVEKVCGFSKEELVPAIPVMPISYGDAEPLLRALGGAAAPGRFQGGLDFSYTVGPSSGTMVKMVVENEEHVGPVWNVIGTVPGALPEELDRPVVLGNHRDAWVFGAVDPNSGTASLIELARGLGALLAEGWKPMRTIILCSWSGEELGMLGSTAWGEEHAEGILANAAAYLNVDSAVSGHILRVKATPSLGGLVKGVLTDVQDPESGGSLLDAWSGDLQRGGSGRREGVFLAHLGIATVDFEFQQDEAAEYGVYHSIYDSFSWVDNYGDPGFRYFQAASRVWGLLALRLATSDVLPFDPPLQAAALQDYVNTLSPSASSSSSSGSGDEVAGNVGGSLVLSETDLAPLQDAVEAFRTAADKGAGGDSGGDGVGVDSAAEAADWLEVADLNERLAMTERRFLVDEGLPGRQWFRHVLQAPGLYLGYAAESFPGITQALSDGDLELAKEQVHVAAARIEDAATFLTGDEGRR